MEEDKLDRKEDVADPKDVSSFVGGGPSSGQEVTAVVDKDNVDRTIESLFERARVVVPGKDVSNVQAFYGYGRRIGHTSDTSLFISPVVREQRTVNIYVYRDGYIIDNGPLFDKQGKDSAEFFNAIAQGYIPGRLEAMYPETDISVRLTDYTDVDYKDARESFPGCGKRLDEHVSTSAVAQKARGGEKSTTGSVPVFQLHEARNGKSWQL
uniref:Uncharacterized protein TCIL3000_7_1570 n=1 Tax=Trypanosoma congolense (strain IL3000) TaxID=1068625 RepID=G0UPN9_TRYCI|nr:unnamed protein product [Trypanosoma congolense IL3000]